MVKLCREYVYVSSVASVCLDAFTFLDSMLLLSLYKKKLPLMYSQTCVIIFYCVSFDALTSL